MREKISPLAGDMRDENLGLESTRAKQLFEEIDIIVNGAAITDFYERYISMSLYVQKENAELRTHAALAGMMLPWHPTPSEPFMYAISQSSVLTSSCSFMFPPVSYTTCLIVDDAIEPLKYFANNYYPQIYMKHDMPTKKI
uniref:Thioester reductase (TE) domain-containing protein n=1 Tax=Setaria viridis TaxID=4556 RepID=A0A4U6WAA3_SETVI|nr:hypothetical protein SEVIR_2G317901v2 [Setaria viridis]